MSNKKILIGTSFFLVGMIIGGDYGTGTKVKDLKSLVDFQQVQLEEMETTYTYQMEELEQSFQKKIDLMSESMESMLKQVQGFEAKMEANRKQQEELDKKGKPLGEYTMTFYDTSHNSQEGWGYQTASGVSLKGKNIHDKLLACPPEIQLGSKLYLEFETNPELNGTYTCVDRGGAIKGKKIDVFYEDYNMDGTVWDMGVKTAKVYLK